MGKRGPAPQPTALKLLRGNPGRRPINDREPQPPAGVPACPDWLDAQARAEWRRVAPALEKLGLLTTIDGAALAGYCYAYSQWRAAALLLREHGLTYARPDGTQAQRAEVVIAQKALGIVRGFCQEFGLTPSARARMVVPGAADAADPFEAFLNG